jgi:hypothetical protein
VGITLNGQLMLMIAAMLVIGGTWGGVELNRRADTAARYVSAFASERRLAAGDITQLRTRGGDDESRITAHYRYTAGGTELTGATPLRRGDANRFAVGSPVGVWYLPSEPAMSWLDGYAPRPMAGWPATALPVACGVAAMAMFLFVRRQSNLLAYGRATIATVTKVEKKRTDKGTIWVVHYEFTTMSGATRAGKYTQGKTNLPAVGATVPIIYDRDNTFRHSRYPMPFVRVKEG